MAGIRITTGLASTLLVVASTSLAQQTDNLTVEVGDCVDLESPDERFACYERRVESARREQQRPEAAASQAPPPVSRQAPPGQLRSDSRNVAVEAAQHAASEATPDLNFMGVIAELRETVPNSHLITLENGQVWRQTLPKFYPLRDGQEVRIYEGRLGFRLAAEEFGGFIRVERVR